MLTSLHSDARGYNRFETVQNNRMCAPRDSVKCVQKTETKHTLQR